MYMRISMRSQIKDPLAQSIVYACSDAEDEKSVCLSFEKWKEKCNGDDDEITRELLGS